MWKISLLLLVGVIFALAQPDLPTLPNDFSAGVEASFLDKGYTTRRWEYYDYDNNRYRLDIYAEGDTYIEIVDATKNVRYEITDWSNCTIHEFNGSRIIDPNSHHLISVSELFRFGSQFEETYTGLKEVRGIPCDSWRSVISETRTVGTSDYTLDWFFSEANWKIQDGHIPEYRIPIRAEINGTTTLLNGTKRDFHHIYDFFFFEIGAPREWVFQLPDFFRCGATLNKELPTLPNDFEMTVEITEPHRNQTSIMHEYYDYDGGHSRVEFHMLGHSLVEIYNAAEQTRVEILDHWNCTIHNSRRREGLRNASSLFHFGAMYNERYRGQRYARGIPCDVWDTDVSETSDWRNTTRNYTLTWYFSVEDWHMRGTGQHRIPIRAEARGTEYRNGVAHPYHEIYEVVHFLAGRPRASVFQTPRHLLCGSTIEKDLPELPSQFNTGLEMTLVERGYTAVLREFYDYDNNRARFDFTAATHSETSIYLIDQGKHYRIFNGTSCTLERFNTSDVPGGHLQSSASFFQFGEEFDEHYQGVHSVRGIPCDVWLRNVTNNFTIADQTVVAKYSVLFSFSIEEWNLRGHHLGSRTHRIPVQAEVQGTESWTNGTVRSFHHYYDFVDFNTEDTPDHFFQLQAHWNCPDYVPPPPACPSQSQTDDDDDSGSGVSSGAAFALWLFGVAVGAAIAVLTTCLVMRRRLRSSPRGGEAPAASGNVPLEDQ